MGKLIALLAAAGAIAAVVFFWQRRGQPSLDSMWSSADEALSSWGTTAADEAGKAADNVAAAADNATSAATEVPDEVKNTITKAGAKKNQAPEAPQ